METHPILNMDCIFDILVAKLLMIFLIVLYIITMNIKRVYQSLVIWGFTKGLFRLHHGYKTRWSSPPHHPRPTPPSLSTFSKYSTNQMIWLVTRKSSSIGWKLSGAKSMDRVFRDSCFTRMCQSFIPPRKCREDHITDQSKILRVTEDWIKTHFCTE